MTRKIWSLLSRQVRWSDGAVASFWFDRLALGLLALSVVLEILGMAVAWGLYDSPVMGLVTMLPVGLALFVAAKVRLRLAVDRAERDGISDRDASVPVIFERFVNISRWQDRLIEWVPGVARRLSRSSWRGPTQRLPQVTTGRLLGTGLVRDASVATQTSFDARADS